MAASGDVTIAQDGGPAKLHPYLVALVRWCVSCLWSTATVMLHRLMTSPLPLTPSPGTTSKTKPRPAGREHLHPEPRVECVVLHQPDTHGLDVIFVHGLYGSLGNTWRQGEWRSKYHSSPEKVHLRRPTASPAPCACLQCGKTTDKNKNHQENTFNNTANKNNNLENINNKHNYQDDYENRFNESRNMFNDYENVSDLMDDYEDSAFTNIDEKFYSDITRILPKDDVFITEKFYNNTLLDQVEIIENYETQVQFVSDLFKNCDINCDSGNSSNRNDYNDNGNGSNNDGNINNKSYYDNCNCAEKKCEVGCGCICDGCYSPCWPKDWIKVDYPNARVISINYTSDPHLWRPLWVKENKRLRLHERADQMTHQLLELGVGQRPVVWVGHSKGGLFIKQIYCEAYEAYLKTEPERINQQNNTEQPTNKPTIDNDNFSIIARKNDSKIMINRNISIARAKDVDIDNPTDLRVEINLVTRSGEEKLVSSTSEEDLNALKRQSWLWQNSVAFMFYSVPHRGSSLADIKTPITARSVELMEISKDNSLVLSLQDRWLRATSLSTPLVRSLVETRRTLMSVLWLRIVSADSADPGIGALCGVSVDHREICKPSSRSCLLYTELASLIRAALDKTRLLDGA